LAINSGFRNVTYLPVIVPKQTVNRKKSGLYAKNAEVHCINHATSCSLLTSFNKRHKLMKTTLLSLSLLVFALAATAQEWKKDRPVSGITSLQVSHGIDVILIQGNSEKLTLEVKGIDENDVKSTVKNGVLTLAVERTGNWNMSWRNTSIKAYLTFKQLKNIQASGGADIESQNSLWFNNLNMSVSGGADVKLSLKADQINLELSGGADVDLQGSVRIFNVEGSGGADLDAGQLVAETCTAYAHGGADISVNANREITLKASGGGDISYSGSARLVSKSESGGGDISRRN